MVADLRGRDPRQWPITRAASIQNFFAARGKHVVYFAGYGELGYQDPHYVKHVAARILRNRSPVRALVHGGTLLRVGGHDGIAEIYTVAKALGFETTGIHPSIAMRFGTTHRVSEHCDHVFFVGDDTWGGIIKGTDLPSPTLRLHLAVSDEMIAIGGGMHAADELRAFAARRKNVSYLPAQMNHAATRDWCRKVGADLPDLRGAALGAWEQVYPVCTR